MKTCPGHISPQNQLGEILN